MLKSRILIVDDAVVVRRMLTEVLSNDPELEIAASAPNGRIALAKIPQVVPDLVILDVEMPEMDGLETLLELRKSYPRLPVIMYSTVTERGAATTLEALSLGANDYVAKPSGGLDEAVKRIREELIPRIKALCHRPPQRDTATTVHRDAAPVREPLMPHREPGGLPHPSAKEPPLLHREGVTGSGPNQVAHRDPGLHQSHPTLSTLAVPRDPLTHRDPPAPRESGIFRVPVPMKEAAPSPRATGAFMMRPEAAHHRSRVDVLAIGVSTGGPNALADLLPALPSDFPVPIVIVQHMPPLFTRLLAERLEAKCQIRVGEGFPGAQLKPGQAWIAPGNFHMVVERDSNGGHLQTNQEPPENSCRPAVDVLFRSVAEVFGPHSLVVVLTGMGQDGLRGCEHIRQAGGQIIVQDEPTSVVWGMPGFVARAGLAEKVLPLPQLAGEIMHRVQEQRFNRVLANASR